MALILSPQNPGSPRFSAGQAAMGSLISGPFAGLGVLWEHPGSREGPDLGLSKDLDQMLVTVTSGPERCWC